MYVAGTCDPLDDRRLGGSGDRFGVLPLQDFMAIIGKV